MIRADPVRRFARAAVIPLAVGVVLVAGATIFAAVFQDRLIHLPSRISLEELEAQANRLGVAVWPTADADHRGLLVEPAGGSARGTVVVFHGNAGQALDRTYWSEAMARLGWRTVLAEYPGYGARDGRLGEAAFVADGLETLALVRGAFDGPIVLAGESLGAGVASGVAAADEARVDGLLLVTPWADLPSLAGEKFPVLPVGMILRDRYDSVANLGIAGLPTAICIAEEDQIIPPHHAERLFASLEVPKRAWRFAGRGHNDWPIEPDASWWREAMTFLAPRPLDPR
jgi:pimeloyl-ACP methyl ester carboxylesterase